MSSRLSQGLHTCLEPRVTESRILRLILAPSKNSNVVVERMDTNAKRNVRTSGWNVTEALSNSSLKFKEPKDQEQVYIHPSVKRSGGRLSEKSLEMCTESLGSETGSNIMEGSETESAFSFLKITSKTSVKDINGHGIRTRKIKQNQKRSFPPPLTSMNAASGFVRVKPHREAGKLILKAVSMPSLSPLFHAERVNGRLTLRVVKGIWHAESGEEEMNRQSSELTRNLESCGVGN